MLQEQPAIVVLPESVQRKPGDTAGSHTSGRLSHKHPRESRNAALHKQAWACSNRALPTAYRL